MTFASRISLSALLLIGTSAVASADTIMAVGQGWCNTSLCNTDGMSELNNTFAGSHVNGSTQTEYRNWFAFELPALPSITSATLHIWNDERSYTERGDATFELRDASERSFAGLRGTSTLGSIGVAAADAGSSRFIAIALNAEGLDLLKASLGAHVLFGGVVTPYTSGREVQIFGYNVGPPAAYLELTGDPAPVPEPSTVLMVITGALALGASARGRRAVALRLLRR